MLVLFSITTQGVFANEVEEALTTNKRFWSIVKTQNSLVGGLVKINQSSYSVEKVRASTPKKENLHSATQTKKAKESVRSKSRVWSIIRGQNSLVEGKVKINKSPYALEKVKKSTPIKESLHSPSQTKKAKKSIRRKSRFWSIVNTQSKVIAGKVKLNKSSYSVNKVKSVGTVGKESRKSYATNSKGSHRSFLENYNAVKPFCNIQATTAFCIRQSQSNHKYTGNTPRRHPRLLDFRDVNSKNRKHESKAFSEQLIRQSNL